MSSPPAATGSRPPFIAPTRPWPRPSMRRQLWPTPHGQLRVIAPAVRLFVERATAADDGFTRTAVNAEAVARIGRQVDGIPLPSSWPPGERAPCGLRTGLTSCTSGSGCSAAAGGPKSDTAPCSPRSSGRTTCCPPRSAWLSTTRRVVSQALIEAEVTDVIGAGPHERSDTRTDQRNGYRARLLSTKAGGCGAGSPEAAPGIVLPVDVGAPPASGHEPSPFLSSRYGKTRSSARCSIFQASTGAMPAIKGLNISQPRRPRRLPSAMASSGLRI
jgi:Transposase, Mutator family